jgi:hypothetical protein
MYSRATKVKRLAKPRSALAHRGSSILSLEPESPTFEKRSAPPGCGQSEASNFRSGTVKVLCSCEVLTTGFDAPPHARGEGTSHRELGPDSSGAKAPMKPRLAPLG